MTMFNFNILIKRDDTIEDVIKSLCIEANTRDDEPFIFSAFMCRDKNNPEYRVLKTNTVADEKINPYTARETVTTIMTAWSDDKEYSYIQPPLEQWLTIFRPFLLRTVSRVIDKYKRLIPDRDELLSLLYTTVITLHNKGYYLHDSLIVKSYINTLNMQCRELIPFINSVSLDACICDGVMTRLDLIEDPRLIDERLETEADEYSQELFEKIKARMLRDMSPLQFERILIQLMTNTIDRSTSYKLDKYRRIFKSSFKPRGKK